MCVLNSTCFPAIRHKFPLLRYSFFLVLTVFALSVSVASGAAPGDGTLALAYPDKARILNNTFKARIPFVANEGQVADRQVLYYARTMGGAAYIKEHGEIVYFFPQNDSNSSGFLEEVLIRAVKTTPAAIDPSKTKVNYLIGRDASKWKTNLKTFHTVNMGDVYQGINLRIKAYGKTLEKIFTVFPGADPNQIRLTFSQAQTLTVLDDGELRVGNGNNAVRFSAPIAYQEIDGKRISVPITYLASAKKYGFRIGDYDRSKPLIIDPCLVFSTYLGGNDQDKAYGIDTDSDGYVYIAGSTNGINDLMTADTDVFVAKFDADAGGPNTLEYLTYIGGYGDDEAFGLAVDSYGHAYLTGKTESNDFPTTLNAYEGKLGGWRDAFVTKLSPDGLSLLYSTFLGGGGRDIGNALTNLGEDIYITGETLSSSFPVTPHAAFSKSRGKVDAFVSHFSFQGSNTGLHDYDLEYSTYLGGNGEDIGHDIAVDLVGNAYVTGKTDSRDFYQSDDYDDDDACVGGDWCSRNSLDTFVVKINPTGDTLLFSKIFGGSYDDSGYGIAVDGDLYVTGLDTITGNSYAFLARLNSTGSLLNYIRLDQYWDGTGYDVQPAIDGIHVVGKTGLSGGYVDTFILALGYNFNLGFSEILGGANDDMPTGLAQTADGQLFISGYTNSPDFPTTVNAHQNQRADGFDAFLVGLDILDSDNDGINNACDNCPLVPNPDQKNTDLENASISGYPAGDDLGDACDPDDDNDLLTDIFEDQYDSLDSKEADSDGDGILDAADDHDEEGLINLEEQNYDTNPDDPDTDNDVWSDNMEVQAETDPTSPSSLPGSETFNSGVYVADPSNPKASDNNLGTEDFPLVSIHAAVDRVNWLEAGDYEIYIASGEYSMANDESGNPIQIHQNVSISPPDGDTGIITIDGLVPDGSASTWNTGLMFLHPDKVNLINIKLINFEVGIQIVSEGGCAVLDNVDIHDCNKAFKLVETFQFELSLSDSEFRGCDMGIVLESSSSNNTIKGARIIDSLVGIAVNGGSGNQMVEPYIGISDGNDLGRYGLLINDGTEEISVIGGTIENMDVGVGFSTSALCLRITDAIIQGCRAGVEFLENYLIHVFLGDSPNETRIQNNQTGIFFRGGSSSNKVHGGIVDSNDYGITFEACSETPDDNQVLGTGMVNNTIVGLNILSGSGNSIIGNESDGLNTEITGSETGIYIADDASGNLIANFNIFGNVEANLIVEGSNNVLNNLSIEPTQANNGINTFTGENNQLTNSTLNGNGSEGSYGLLIEEGAEAVVLENTVIEDFDVGVQLALDAACVTFSGINSVTCTTGNCNVGLLIVERYMLDIDLGDTTISGFDTGIKIAAGSSNNVIRNGIVHTNRLDGILMDGAGESPDENQVIGTAVYSNGRNGIALMSGFGNQVSDSIVYENNSEKIGSGGIAVFSGSASVTYNKVYANHCAGIYADEVAPVDIIGNVIYSNPEGIRLAFTSNATVMSNTVAANTANGLVIEPGSTPALLYNILYGNVGLDLMVEDAFYNVEYGSLDYNTIGTTNLPWLPTSNIPLDPEFASVNSNNFSLRPTSPAIDATKISDPGRDLIGERRPQGNYWDMGAYEAPEYIDNDDDGLPDWWEILYSEDPNGPGLDPYNPNDADRDDDGDGLSNLDEYLLGSDPTNPVAVSIDLIDGIAAENPYYTNADTLTLSGSWSNATQVVITGTVITTTGKSGDWSSNVTLSPGENQIIVTADDEHDNTPTASAQITIIKDAAPPQVSINNPTNQDTYTTALDAIVIGGSMSDDTDLIKQVTYTVSGGSGALIAIVEGSTWRSSPIGLSAGDNIITVTAEDMFGKTSFDEITVTVEANISNAEGDLSGTASQQANPLDPDNDEYLSEDELVCGSNPNDIVSKPVNTHTNRYPTDPLAPYFDESKVKKNEFGDIIGSYLWPDCLNPDDDSDRLPDWWEAEYGYDPIDADSDDNGVTDSDENPDNDQLEDGSAYTNFEEYQNGTNPYIVQTIMFGLTAHTVQDLNFVTNIYDAWLPNYQDQIVIKAEWLGVSAEAPALVVFSLKETSRYPGRAVNDPDPNNMAESNYPVWYPYDGFDFGLTNSENDHSFDQGTITAAKQSDGDGNAYYTIYLQCWDYGGRTKVFVTSSDDPQQIALNWYPKGSGTNGIADAWQFDNNDILEPNKDVDAIKFDNPGFTAPLGDDFSNFDEYRGIIYTETPGVASDPQHMRLNPFHKDLFIRGVGFSAAYPFAIGNALANADIDVHITTDWGHDATETYEFFTDYRTGNILSIGGFYGNEVTASGADWLTTWPKHEWELRLDVDQADESAWTPIGSWGTQNFLTLDMAYQGDGNQGAYTIRRSLPHINVLTVWHDDQSDSLFSWDDGHIKFVAATAPNNQNPLGVRYWNWSVKGYAKTVAIQEQEYMYGIAFTLQKPLDNYFEDRPYVEGTLWDSTNNIFSDLAIADNKLSPLSLTEDYMDSGTPLDGYTDPNLGILPGNTPDGKIDGDHRLLNPADWAVHGMLSPFDVNNNMVVELPFASDPDNIDPAKEMDDNDNYYTKARVLKHTITHEICHALGGPSHTSDPTDLMYKYSNNWKRDDHLSDYYRSLLRIHNKKRW